MQNILSQTSSNIRSVDASVDFKLLAQSTPIGNLISVKLGVAKISAASLNKIFCRLLESGFRVRHAPGYEVSREGSRPLSTFGHEPLNEHNNGTSILIAQRQAVNFRTYRRGDEHAILAMFECCFGEKRTFEHWRWKYQANPYDNELIALGADPQGKILGHYAAYPLRMYAAKEKTSFDTVHGGDTMTDRAARSYGVGPQSILGQMGSYHLSRFLAGKIPWGFGFNTDVARRFGARYLGYQHLPIIQTYSIAWAHSAADQQILSEWTIQPIKRFGADFDTFFHQVAADYGILTQRDQRYLNWRYADCPDQVHKTFAAYLNGKMQGWAVFRKQGQRLIWGDGLIRRDVAPHCQRLLLDTATEQMGANKIETWAAPSPSWWRDSLLEQGFTAEAEPAQLAPMIIRFSDQFSYQQICDHWFYTKGDSDLF